MLRTVLIPNLFEMHVIVHNFYVYRAKFDSLCSDVFAKCFSVVSCLLEENDIDKDCVSQVGIYKDTTISVIFQSFASI